MGRDGGEEKGKRKDGRQIVQAIYTKRRRRPCKRYARGRGPSGMWGERSSSIRYGVGEWRWAVWGGSGENEEGVG